MQTISTGDHHNLPESSTRNVNINIFHIFQVYGSYFLKPSEPGPGAMVVIKTLAGDTRAGARPPTPQPASSPGSLCTSLYCHDCVTHHVLIFLSASHLSSCCHQTLLCARGSLVRRQSQTDFPLSPVTRRTLLTAQSGITLLSVSSSSDALESLANT